MTRMKLPKLILTASLLCLLMVANSGLKANEKEVAAEQISIPFELTPTGLQVVTLTYGGGPIQMILDTGAGANVFSQEAAKRLKLPLKDSAIQGAGIGGQRHAMARVSPIIVVSGKKQLMLRNVVSTDLSQALIAAGTEGIDGLLGSPFFQAHKAQIDFSTNTLILNIDQENVEQDGADQPATAPGVEAGR